jgi:phosphate transport system permease protein
MSTPSDSASQQISPPRRSNRGDAVARVIFPLAGVIVLLLMGAIAVFLMARAAPAFTRAGSRFFTEKQFFPEIDHPKFGILALAFGTVASSVIALLLAVPVALGCALFVAELAPGRIGSAIGSLVDLLAAVPSVVYGLWGVFFLRPHLGPIEKHIDSVLGFLPPLHSRSGTYGHSIFDAGVILAVMVIPIVAALSREVFRQVPSAHREAALALGATRWEMIRLAVLPYGRGGLIGAVMLGLGRAMGETIAVAMMIGGTFIVNAHVVEPGGATIASNIATKFGESGPAGREALIATGLVLFAITFAVNLFGRSVVTRSLKRAQA